MASELILQGAVRPDWSAPDSVHALVTTRHGGISTGVFSTLNLALHVDDDPDTVAENRRRLLAAMRLEAPCSEPQWLTQVHGIHVVDAITDEAERRARAPEADAVYTDQPGIPCVVMTADCLPVFFCSKDGREVAVAHAGWKGLVGGVLEATVARFQADAADVRAWLGPAIGPDVFEVGAEVRDVFLGKMPGCSDCFRPSSNAGRYLADLYRLAKRALADAGVVQVSGGGECTYADVERFFSYRRESRTGRMASVIWRT